MQYEVKISPEDPLIGHNQMNATDVEESIWLQYDGSSTQCIHTVRKQDTLCGPAVIKRNNRQHKVLVAEAIGVLQDKLTY